MLLVSEVSLSVAKTLALNTRSNLLARLLREREKAFYKWFEWCHAEKVCERSDLALEVKTFFRRL